MQWCYNEADAGHVPVDGTEQSMMPEKEIFAIHTSTGFEDEVQKLIWAVLPDISTLDHFVPQRVFYFRRNRRWHKQVRDLFPGYIFIRSADPEQLYFSLKSVPKFTRLLEYDAKDDMFIPLSEAERNFIELICSVSVSEIRKHSDGGATRFIVPGSRVEIIPKEAVQPGDTIRPRSDQKKVLRIIDGPLLKLNPYVSKIDFSNREAILDQGLCGNSNIHIGIKLIKDNIPKPATQEKS